MSMEKKRNNKKDTHPVFRTKLTFGQKAANDLANFCGSWKFIFILVVIIIIWIGLNFYAYEQQWDPYPFVLLNLVLACITALQVPIILMSQNRQAERDRINAKYDYLVNRKSEREIEIIQKDLKKIMKILKRKNSR